MRHFKSYKDSPNSVIVKDEPGQGGACHQYEVILVDDDNLNPIFANVSFQNGPVKEFGFNGCQNEDLLSIVADRLECFQVGEFSCRENALALTKIQEAIHWLRHRTIKRELRGVEGKNIK